MKLTEATKNLIREIAKSMGIEKELTEKDIKRAHKFAGKDNELYYERLKAFFTN